MKQKDRPVYGIQKDSIGLRTMIYITHKFIKLSELYF